MSQPIEKEIPENQGENQNNNEPLDVSDLSPDQLKEELRKVRQEAASRRIENRELKTAADKWKEYEESQKTELQKLQDQIAERDKQLSAYQLQQTKASIAKEVGLDAEDAELLSGTDEESIRKQAEKLKSRLGNKEEKKPGPVDLLAGSRGKPIGSSSDASGDSFMDQMIRGSARRVD